VRLPSLTIITPSYNQAEFIEHTIRSVLDQQYPEIEYWVMDGGSTDGTVDILKRYSDRLKYVSQKDGGQSAALNDGFRRTHNEIIGWINSDDVYLPGALQAVGEYFAAHPETEWLYGRCPIIDRQGEIHKSWVTSYKEFWMRRYSYQRYLIENFISQPAVFFRRRLLDRVGPIDEQYHCAFDYHLFVRMATAARPAFLERELACFRSYGENKSSSVYQRSFTEELDAARRVAAGKHPVLMALHAVNRVKLTLAYDLLALLSRV
jgi:glycosyltransferase involved in cell wall biosynthesis